MNTPFAIACGMFFLRAALLLSCFWIVYWLLRPHPRARVMLCRVVSVAVVLLPVLGFLPVPVMLSLPRLRHADTPKAFALPVLDEVSPAQSVNPGIPDAGVSTSIPAPSAAPVITPVHPWKMPHWPLSQALAAAWLAVASLPLALRGAALFAARRMGRVSAAPPDWIGAEARQLAARIGIRRGVAVRIAEKDGSPLLIGPRPLILLPRRLLSEDSRADVRAALAHELVHVKQHDWHWSQWLHFVAILAWPLPPAWFLRRAHDAASELVCDSVAAAATGGAEPYASSLARQSLYALGHPQPATVPMLRKSGIRKRIDLLLSGATLPPFSRRAALCTAALALVACALLGGLRPARAAEKPAANNENPPAQNADIKKALETVAEESSYFEIRDVVYWQPDFMSGPTEADTPKYRAFLGRLLSIQAGKDDLLPLLKHENPKVRTLAIAKLVTLDDPSVLPAFADMLSDDAITFTRKSSGPDQTIRTDVTVGESAQQVLFCYLMSAGYSEDLMYRDFASRNEIEIRKMRKDFDDYWSKHKDLDYCASWFYTWVQMVPGARPSTAEKRRAIRARLEKVPQPERTGIALWCNNMKEDHLLTDEELVAMCREVGTDALMNVLKAGRLPGNDPDFQHPDSFHQGFLSKVGFILENAGSLLRPQDADALLALNTGKNTSRRWAIAAAQLQYPEKAAQTLHQAFEQFTDSYDRLSISGALWRDVGESETAFITDQFYKYALPANNPTASEWGGAFVNGFAYNKKPSGRKLIAAILQDNRLDSIATNPEALSDIFRVVNEWAPHPIVSDAEIAEALKNEPSRVANPASPNLALRKALLHRLRDSVPQWDN